MREGEGREREGGGGRGERGREGGREGGGERERLTPPGPCLVEVDA